MPHTGGIMKNLEKLQKDDNLTPYEKFEKLTKGVLKVSKDELTKKLEEQKVEKVKKEEKPKKK